MSNKLIFEKIWAKNFRSVGNMGMELDYLKTPTTLIASTDNGAGKSTLAIWALYYALFGKAYKKGVKLGSLVNSRSGKESLVTVEFETMGSKWLVRRGQKPAVFDIERDGKRVEDEAALADYQGYLESVIGMDETAFCFVVALGPDKFVPFCSMSAGERRSFVEQILDITIISSMNDIAKADLKEVRKAADQLFYEISNIETKISGHQRTYDILLNKKYQRLQETTGEIEALMEEETKILKLFEQANDKVRETSALVDNVSEIKLTQVKDLKQKMERKQELALQPALKIASLDICPTCSQHVTEDHKHSIKSAAEEEADKLTEPLQRLETELQRLQGVVDTNAELKEKTSRFMLIASQLSTKLEGVRGQIKSIRAKMVNDNEDDQIASEGEAIIKLKATLAEKEKELQELRTKETDYNHLLQILKDDAVKSEIVKQYLPFLNQKINEYLDSMNLYVQLNLDEEFNVSMFAPDRKGQTIENLSTGQLRRVDLAVLLAWREVARAKASVSTNLLVLDEILENLSQQGVADFAELWETKFRDKGLNLFVISQRNDEFSEYFDRSIVYALKDERTVEV